MQFFFSLNISLCLPILTAFLSKILHWQTGRIRLHCLCWWYILHCNLIGTTIYTNATENHWTNSIMMCAIVVYQFWTWLWWLNINVPWSMVKFFFSLLIDSLLLLFFFCLIVWINGCVKCQIDWNAYIFIAGWNNWISCFTISLTTHNDLFDMISNERNELTTHTRKHTNIKHEKTHTHMYCLKEIESIKWSERERRKKPTVWGWNERARARLSTVWSRKWWFCCFYFRRVKTQKLYSRQHKIAKVAKWTRKYNRSTVFNTQCTVEP